MDAELRERLIVAANDLDPEAVYYLDTVQPRVIRVRDGRTDWPQLTPEAVEDDEARFLDAPIVITSGEFVWMSDFAAEHPEKRVKGFLDGRKGAGPRFLKRLAKNAPEVFAEWEQFRSERVIELVDDWILRLERA